MSPNIAIGIDLGTTNSCVAIFHNGKVEIIPNSDGHKTTPSEVAFTDVERLVGQAAKNQGARNPKNTIFDVKRLIGRQFDDPELQEDIKNFPFRIVSKDSKPVVEVEFKGEKKQFTPEEISATILQTLKDTAERYLGCEVKNVVITVPAYFNQGQRQATKDAALIAGLNPLRIINEPTAAALAYGLGQNSTKTVKILVFDLGGGTFDVSILTITPDSVYEVNATNGDTHLGGSDFDGRLLDHCIEEFARTHSDITANSRAVRRLRTACELAKKNLSTSVETVIYVDALSDGIDFGYKITRDRFEELCDNLFCKTLDPVVRALRDAKFDKDEIDEVVLVGGSTRIPKIQQLLKEFFNGKVFNNSINPDEAVAYGAAAQAAILSGVRFNSFGKLLLRDVTPLTLGVNVKGGLMSNVVRRNTPIPLKKTEPFTTIKDYQTSILFEIFEGERTATMDNHKLDEFLLKDIISLPRCKAKIDATFEINEDGILTVTAVERSTGKENSVVIKKGRLDTIEISRMIEEAEKYQKEDKAYKERVEALNKLEDYAYKIRDFITENAENIRSEGVEILRKAWENELAWLDNNRDALKDVYVSRHEGISRICEPIIARMGDYND